MANSYPLDLVATPQVVPFAGSPGPFHNLILSFDTAPSAGTVLIEYRSIGSPTFRPISHAAGVSITSGFFQVRLDGSVAAVRVTFTGLVGGVGARIWDDVSDIPAGAYNGLAAAAIQTYIEANIKNGVQYEISSNTPALANNGNIDTIFTTGPNPVIIKKRDVLFNGTSVAIRVYRAPTFTGGSVVPYFNLNDRNPVAGTVVIRTGATVTAPGTEFGAPTFSIGSEGQGNSSLSTFSSLGFERILAPNTVYLQRITNDSGATERVTTYLSWYEGGTDLPL